MFFVLSKTLSFLAMPLVLVILLFVASALMRSTKWKKRLFWIALTSLVFFSNDFIANEAMKAWEIPPTPFEQITKTYDYGILLTGVTSNNLFPDDRVYFKHGADRVVHTIDLYKRGIIKKILISGGTGRLFTDGRPEADELYKVMIMMGVESNSIQIENESRNTYESAVNVKELMGDGTAQQLVLITSAFHMRRSKRCFDKAGIQVDTFTTDFYSHPRYYTPGSLLVPSVEAWVVWQKLAKEWTGFIAYWIAGYI